jgi:vitamin B12 transporter
VTVNANAGWWLRPGVELFARVDNLLDEEYEEVAGFGTAGASAYGGVNVVW